jgi:iron-sulfur cluster repair protein YtfE (RIC family)
MKTFTSSPLVEAIRTHHAELAQKLTEYAGQLDAGSDQFDAPLLTQLGSFLTDELLPHAQGEERVLYPALDPVLAQHGSPTATMCIDHEYLTQFIQQATALAGKLRSVGQRERDPIAAQLQQVLGQLQTLLTVHLAKEERVYLPLVEQQFSPAEQERLLGELHEEAAASPPKPRMGTSCWMCAPSYPPSATA